jgi:hypothetical protein
MTNPDQTIAAKAKPDRETMKSLCLGMVSDLSRLLTESGFGEQPLDIVELLAFAMFVIADTYALADPREDQAREVIQVFYDDLQDHFIAKTIVKDYRLSEAEEIQSVADQFHDLSRRRFQEYGEKFRQDVSDPLALSCPTLVSCLLDNLFIQPLDQADKLKLMGPVSDRVLSLWAGCVQYFK